MQFPPPLFVALAGAVALFGTWTSLDLFRRVHANVGRARIAWLTAGSLSLGLGVWAIPTICLLGLDFGRSNRLDASVLLFALVLASVGAGAGFTLMARRGR